MTTPAQGHHPSDTIPRGLLLAAAAMLLVVTASVVATRWSGTTIRAPDAPAVVVVPLRFEDRADGAVAVIDARSGQLIEAITGQAGFVRGTLRGLARERKRSGVGSEPAFELIGRADGRLTLHDPTTGRMVDLESFGPINSGVFARLLPTPAQR
jgi:putative photosynthetic complex assembly protein